MQSYFEQVEINRQKFLKDYKNFKKINLIIMGAVTLAVGLVLIFLLPANQMAAVIVIVALLIGTFTYTKAARAKLSNQTYDYIFAYYREYTQQFFNAKAFKNLDIKEKEGLTVDDFSRTDLFDNTSNVVSRNFFTVEANDVRIIAADLGAHIKVGKKTQLVFYGKLFYLPFDLNHHNESMIAYVKPLEMKEPPKFNPLYQVVEETSQVIYYAKTSQLPAYFSKKLKKWIEELIVGEGLLDAFVSIQEDQLFVGYSFNEAIMNIPYQTKIDEVDFLPYQKEISRLVQLTEVLKPKNPKKELKGAQDSTIEEPEIKEVSSVEE